MVYIKTISHILPARPFYEVISRENGDPVRQLGSSPPKIVVKIQRKNGEGKHGPLTLSVIRSFTSRPRSKPPFSFNCSGCIVQNPQPLQKCISKTILILSKSVPQDDVSITPNTWSWWKSQVDIPSPKREFVEFPERTLWHMEKSGKKKNVFFFLWSFTRMKFRQTCSPWTRNGL